MRFVLSEIPGLALHDQTIWHVRTLTIETINSHEQTERRDLAQNSLHEWQASALADYKKIILSLRLVGTNVRVKSEHHVKKGDIDGTYEARAHTRNARLMFFYTEVSGQKFAICTNGFWKTGSDEAGQDSAFELCERLMKAYLKTITPKHR